MPKYHYSRKLGLALQKALQEKHPDMSVTELSKELEIPRKMLSDFLNGNHIRPNLHVLIKLARFLDISLDQLVQDEELRDADSSNCCLTVEDVRRNKKAE